ncbi:hypothetical protein [Variovorax sp. KK3]|uniref:immunity protein TriTu family protein n=1 Tax=Variovorax sp. KK3 TaxID=1855728 RepID=UPI001180ABE2|nr:hypothetical protein [Variovorax sp. KK3]
MLNAFLAWAHRMEAAGASQNMQAQITKRQDPDNPSIRLDLETPSTFGRVIFWKSGHFEAKVVAKKNSAEIYLKLGAVEQEKQVPKMFAPFVGMLGMGQRR